MNDESSVYRDEPAGERVKAKDRSPPPSRNSPPLVYVTRLSNAEFAWEHRVFGAIVVAEGQITYATEQLAREAGGAALGFPAL